MHSSHRQCLIAKVLKGTEMYHCKPSSHTKTTGTFDKVKKIGYCLKKLTSHLSLFIASD